MKKFLVIAFILISTQAFAGFNVCYDTDGKNLYKTGSSPINGCIYYDDYNMSEYERVKALDLKYQQVVDNVVVAIPQTEKDLIIANELQAGEDAKVVSIESLDITVKQLVDALESKGVITKTEIVDKVKLDENITTVEVIK